MTQKKPRWVAAVGLGAVVFAAGSCSKSFEGKADATGGTTGGAGGSSGDAQGGASGSDAGKGGGATGGAGGTSSGGEAGAGAEPTGGTGTGGGNGGTNNNTGGTEPEGGAGTGPGTPTYRETVLADHPLVYWRMGISSGLTVRDETGGGNTLVLQGTGHTLGAAGAIRDDTDTAIGFDGVSSFAIATDARALDFTDRAPFTLECWARRITGGTGYFQHLFSNIVGSPGDRDGYVLYLIPEPDMTTNQRSSFEYDRPGTEISLWGPVPEESAWAYYAAVVDGTTASLYVNGTLESNEPIDDGFAARTGPFAVGRAANEDAHRFKGDLDEMAVYARALPISDIVEHYGFIRQ